MTEALAAWDGTIGAGSPSGRGPVHDHSSGAVADLRRIGIHPDFWYPVAESRSVRKGKTLAATFAGERIALYRAQSGTVYALEDRCAHRQVPLSMGVVEGDALRCCYHAWAYRGNGRIWQIPYLPKGSGRPPRGVRAYPAREAYGLVFVFPGDQQKAATTALPELPEFNSAKHKTMTFSRTVRCHYSFMHENLLDMNHQFLHRGVVGRIQPELLGYDADPRSVEARYLFTHAGGKRDHGAGLLAGGRSRVAITIRTAYPYQTLHLVRENAVRPAFSLWAAYVPEDAEQRTNHVYGLLMIKKPPIPGSLHLAWPFIRHFTERVFAEDRMAVEAEQRAWDEQGEDWNHEVFPLIIDVRDVLRTNGVPIRPESAIRGATAVCRNSPLVSRTPRAEPCLPDGVGDSLVADSPLRVARPPLLLARVLARARTAWRPPRLEQSLPRRRRRQARSGEQLSRAARRAREPAGPPLGPSRQVSRPTARRCHRMPGTWRPRSRR